MSNFNFNIIPKNAVKDVNIYYGYSSNPNVFGSSFKTTSNFLGGGTAFIIHFNKALKFKQVTIYDEFDSKVTTPKAWTEFFTNKASDTFVNNLSNKCEYDGEYFKTHFENDLSSGDYSISVEFIEDDTTETPTPEPEEPHAEQEPSIQLFVEGFCKNIIQAYNDIDELVLDGQSPVTIYQGSGTSKKNCANSDDIYNLYIPTDGKAKLVKVVDESGLDSGFTKEGHNEVNFSDVILSGTSSTKGIELRFKTGTFNELDVTELHLHFQSVTPVITPCKITYQLGNCSSSIQTNTVSPNKDVSIILTADDGYEFVNTPTIVHNNKPIAFTISNDKKSASINFTPTNDFIVSGSATKIGGSEPVTKVSRFIDVYLPDSSQLDKLKEIRWVTASGSGDSMRGNDINTNISAMYQTFIKIPSNGVKNCKIAGYDTKISIPYTDSVLTDVKSEEVMFEEKYNSAMDYEPHTQCKIYLPFCGIFTIPTNHVIGKTIQLVYTCNLYTCDCECRIYSDHTLVQSESGKFGFEYPFRTIERTNVRIESSNYFSDLVPKIIITRHNFVTLDEHRPISYTAKASEINGYFEADNIQFDIESLAGYTWITKDDVDHIESALRGGVVNNK